MTFTRKEIIEGCILYLADCAALLPNLPPVNAVITDPPYGIGQAAGMGTGGFDGTGKIKRASKQYAGSWDNERPDPQIFQQLLELSETQIIWGGNYFADILPVATRWLFWDKVNNMPSYSDGEMAWTSLPGSATKKFTYSFSGGPQSKRDGERVHPTQKPVALMSWCLSLLPPGSSVVDPFMGSGTTGVACAKNGMPFIGIERDPAYFDIACERIRDAYLQADIFGTPPAAAIPVFEQSSLFGDHGESPSPKSGEVGT